MELKVCEKCGLNLPCFAIRCNHCLSSPTSACSSADIESQVASDILERQKLGIQKYGRTLANNPLSLNAWLQHAYEECLDQAVYLKRAMVELEKRS